MDKVRIQVYTDRETKRRVDVAALKRNTSVTDYCVDAIRQRLAEDELLEADRVVIDMRRSKDHVLDRVAALHDAVLARREGRAIDVDGILERTREERLDEILGLR